MTASHAQQLADIIAAALGLDDHDVADAVDAVIDHPELLRAIADQQRPSGQSAEHPPPPSSDARTDRWVTWVGTDYNGQPSRRWGVFGTAVGDDMADVVESDGSPWCLPIAALTFEDSR